MRKLLLISLIGLAACGSHGQGSGPLRRVRVPLGASFGDVADSLEAKGILESTTMFRIWARLTGAASDVKAGTYEFHQGAGWRTVLDDLTAGRIATDRVVVPEGFDIRRIAPEIARVVGLPSDSVVGYMLDTATADHFDVPGPTLEGYLYPATYVVPVDVGLAGITQRMVIEYRRIWTPARVALADSAGLSRRQVVTLASIVEKEAKISAEMPTIAAVYLNRLRIHYPLQADPTVQYALGEHQNRLLYADIRRVAKDPYNTYTHPGLPPGPIGSPSARAIDAVLHPADVRYLYFVARPDGSHAFSRSLTEHNRAKERIRQTARANHRTAASGTAPGPQQ